MGKKSLTTDWIYYSPSFKFIKELPLDSSAWSGHYFFAYDLVRNVKPKVIVELGTHKGNSLFSMAQAIKDGKLKIELHGVDTWEGDPQAGYYAEDIYNEFLKISKQYYKDVNIISHKMFFDDAVKKFKDNSIDILHIDGLHTYEAVKHDFETWLPKVKKDTGIIMFHDVCETKDDFGVYKLWEELQKKYKNTITFEHYHGLGVLFINKEMFKKYENQYYTWTKLYTELSNIECQKDEIVKREIYLLTQQQKYLDSIKDLETENQKLAKELKEYGGFKYGRFWKLLTVWRTVKADLKNKFTKQ